MITRLILLLILSLGFPGCNTAPDKPDPLIKEGKYIKLLAELQLVRSYGEDAETDSATVDSLISEIYQKYNITARQFHQSHHYYQQFPKEQKKRIALAIEQLKMELVTKKDSTASADSAKTAQ